VTVGGVDGATCAEAGAPDAAMANALAESRARHRIEDESPFD
jgi:hypothetical protein